MKLPLKALATFAASPQGRRLVQQARTKLDTPENRAKATAAFRKATDSARRRGRPEASAPAKPQPRTSSAT